MRGHVCPTHSQPAPKHYIMCVYSRVKLARSHHPFPPPHICNHRHRYIHTTGTTVMHMTPRPSNNPSWWVAVMSSGVGEDPDSVIRIHSIIAKLFRCRTRRECSPRGALLHNHLQLNGWVFQSCGCVGKISSLFSLFSKCSLNTSVYPVFHIYWNSAN